VRKSIINRQPVPTSSQLLLQPASSGWVRTLLVSLSHAPGATPAPPFKHFSGCCYFSYRCHNTPVTLALLLLLSTYSRNSDHSRQHETYNLHSICKPGLCCHCDVQCPAVAPLPPISHFHCLLLLLLLLIAAAAPNGRKAQLSMHTAVSTTPCSPSPFTSEPWCPARQCRRNFCTLLYIPPREPPQGSHIWPCHAN